MWEARGTRRFATSVGSGVRGIGVLGEVGQEAWGTKGWIGHPYGLLMEWIAGDSLCVRKGGAAGPFSSEAVWPRGPPAGAATEAVLARRGTTVIRRSEAGVCAATQCAPCLP